MNRIKNPLVGATAKLPTELTSIVNESLDLLGQAAKIEYGLKIFNEIEKIRTLYKKQRSSAFAKKLETHTFVSKRIEKKKPEEKLAIAHCFAASLELINAAENAYRSFRLPQSPMPTTDKALPPIIFVLTAHPTEARSPAAIAILEQISSLMLKKIREKQLNEQNQKQLFHLMVLLIKTPISKTKAPTVEDEAEYIYSIILKKQNIEKLCDYFDKSQPVYIRTWVGGDKDGHPGVNDKTMMSSLSLSRKKLLPFAQECLKQCKDQLSLIKNDSEDIKRLHAHLESTNIQLKNLKIFSDGDGLKLNLFYKSLSQIILKYRKVIGTDSPDLERISTLLKVFPGLVVPLELREDAALIKESLSKPGMEIAKMLKQLCSLSISGKASWYVRGIVISMCESDSDVENTIRLLKKNLGGLYIPIVPLFETRAALESSSELTHKIFAIPDFKKALETLWDKKYEVMVGYSDSSKESGALFSRVIIKKSLSRLDKLVRQKGYTPIFFHGSGGSVARGGGSLREQMAWWPKSAQQRFKATIQGEMIHRTFSSVEIFERHISVIRESTQKVKAEAVSSDISKSIYAFSDKVRLCYYEKVTNPEFMQMVSMATPYPYLDQLKIGSRPSKRKSSFDLNSLRAIPWVLCWTQTRVLFPVWWGLGQTWNRASRSEKETLRIAYNKSSLFRSFVDLLSYTLAKVDLSVWAFCLEKSPIEASLQKKYIAEFRNELQETQKFIQDITGKKELLWFRPWLKESIMLRSTLIYPLNILEVDALHSKDVPLIRETVTGVASGMLTTG